jgi:hypothetical protein
MKKTDVFWSNRKRQVSTAKKIVLIATLILSVFALGPQKLNCASAESPQPLLTVITVQSDGNINSSTTPISHNGNNYTLIDDIISSTLDIQCDNITVDGAGYKLSGKEAAAWLNGPWPGILIEANGVTIKNFTIEGYNGGIESKGKWNKIIDNRFDFNDFSVYIDSDYNDLLGNFLAYGNVEVDSNYNNVSKNVLSGCAIDVHGNYNNLIGNTAPGIFLGGTASYNNIVGNTIKDNINGIYLIKQPNTFYANNFINNKNNIVLSEGTSGSYSMNVFDKNTIGNYWNDYKGIDANNDDIGDSPYKIAENLEDKYPLMRPFNSSNVNTLPTINSAATPMDPLYVIGVVTVIFTIASVVLTLKKRKQQSSMTTPRP